MPTPASPVVLGLQEFEVVLGENQPEYIPLHTLRGVIPESHTSRWELTPEERAMVADGADVYVTTLGRPPITIDIAMPEVGPPMAFRLISEDDAG